MRQNKGSLEAADGPVVRWTCPSVHRSRLISLHLYDTFICIRIFVNLYVLKSAIQLHSTHGARARFVSHVKNSSLHSFYVTWSICTITG